MRRPVTTLMLVVALIGGGVLAPNCIRVAIFPSLDPPRIDVLPRFGGMSPLPAIGPAR
jgi:multidrug efflux pump subunit AcrB